jgi:hypothetical protein
MLREQWICPVCGRRLHVPNQEHSCESYSLEHHFAGKGELAPRAYEWVRVTLESCGPTDIHVLKTMILFQARSNLASLQFQKNAVVLSLMLDHSPMHPRFVGANPYGRLKSICRFKIENPDQLDSELDNLLRSAYRLGSG